MPEPQKLNIGVAELEPKAHGEPSSAVVRDIGRLKQYYTFDDEKDVSRFLAKTPHLIPLLFEAPGPIREIFGEGVPLSLHMLYDPEGDLEGMLFCDIPSYRSVEESMALLDRFDMEWWNTQPESHNCDLFFTLDMKE